MALWLPDELDSLRVWLKADAIVGLNDDDPVATWADSSTYEHDATQATEAKKPIYKTGILDGKAVLRFTHQHPNGSNLTLGDLSSDFPSAATLFVLVTMGTNPSDAYAIFDTATGRGGGITYWDLGGDGYLGTFRTARIDGYPAGMPASNSGTKLFGLVSSATTYAFYINSTVKTGGTASYDSCSGEANYKIGSDELEPFGGDIAEVILFNAELTTDERQLAEGYLAWKWGQEGSLPGGHPWESEAPTVAGYSYLITAQTDETASPNTWSLLGSDNEEDWVVLDTQSSITFSPNEEKEFGIEEAYKYYKLDVTKTNGASFFDIHKLTLPSEV